MFTLMVMMTFPYQRSLKTSPNIKGIFGNLKKGPKRSICINEDIDSPKEVGIGTSKGTTRKMKAVKKEK